MRRTTALLLVIPWLAREDGLRRLPPPGGAAAVVAAPHTGTETVDTAAAVAALGEFDELCRAHGGVPWGVPLCGPIVLVDPPSRLAVANRPDPERAFVSLGSALVGRLPPDVPIANTAVEWRGTRWTMVMLPLPTDRFNRLRLLAHESFHRIQPALGAALTTPVNAHLEERDARLWLRLELRALVRALEEEGDDAARRSAADAMLFRAHRNRLYPGSDTLEALLEMGEGLAEYAGIRFAATATGETPARAGAWAQQRFERTPSFARALGYGTGPPLGLLLDRWRPGWQAHVAAMRSPARELAAALGLPAASTPPGPPAASAIVSRARRYGHDSLATEEDARAVERAARLADYRRRLVDGPVLVLPLRWLGGGFNPNTVVPFGALGTVYPRRTFESDWGVLEVTGGGGLVAEDHASLRIEAPPELPDAARATVSGPGWVLTLAPGWSVRRAARPGDFEVARDNR
ncbi:MAG TPA: hypothetical protein VKA84_22605 [Gemmatimonadaceae bacterium]|nr:hypothetical protein [Gemmatimonadaceae bacterium]